MLEVNLLGFERHSDVSTSNGIQDKWFKDGIWYKEDCNGLEGYVEWLVSKVLEYSNIGEKNYVSYEKCNIIYSDEDGFECENSGCYSKNFVPDGKSFITIYRYLKTFYNIDAEKKLQGINSTKDKLDYLLSIVNEDWFYSYISDVLSLDRLILNEDRHLNNYGVFLSNGKVERAPIFDNGKSLLCQSKYRGTEVKLNTASMSAKPKVIPSWDEVYNYLDKKFKVDYIGLLSFLNSLSGKDLDEYTVKVLKYQLKKYVQYYSDFKFYALMLDGKRIGTRVNSCGRYYDTYEIVKGCIGNIVMYNVGGEALSSEEISGNIKVNYLKSFYKVVE